jgi:hypothetical protein
MATTCVDPDIINNFERFIDNINNTRDFSKIQSVSVQVNGTRVIVTIRVKTKSDYYIDVDFGEACNNANKGGNLLAFYLQGRISHLLVEFHESEGENMDDLIVSLKESVESAKSGFIHANNALTPHT